MIATQGSDVAASGEELAWSFGQRLLQHAEQSCILEARRIRLKGPGAAHEEGIAGMGSRKGIEAVVQINVVHD